MSKVQDQIAALSQHLYAQHQAAKEPMHVDRGVLRVNTLGGGVEEIGVEEYTVNRVRGTVPLAPGVHPVVREMGPRYIPGRVEVEATVNLVSPMALSNEQIATILGISRAEAEVPSIGDEEQPPKEKKYSRKLEP